MQDVEFVVVGCVPAGGIAAREAARGGIETLVLEKDAVVGRKRVCAAGLRPGFCQTFDLPRSIVHCDTPTVALHALAGRRYEFTIDPGHTTTREELDGTIGELAASEGATIATRALFRGYTRDGERAVVHYVDGKSGERRAVRARHVLLAQGASVRIPAGSPLGFEGWNDGLVTCYQYRVYLEREAAAETYRTLEMHYYVGRSRRNVVAWMFPKRDHLSIGLGVQNKLEGCVLRAELDSFLETVEKRLFPGVAYTLREEGNLLYCGAPRPQLTDGCVMIGGTAAGLVDATTGEGIYEAAMSGRRAAAAILGARQSNARDAAPTYERTVKSMFYGRLRRRERLMSFLLAKPKRFDVLFEQLASFPRFSQLLQRQRDDYTPGEKVYLYGQAALFALRAAAA